MKQIRIFLPTVLAVAYTAAAFANSLPSEDNSLRGSLSDIHLKMVGGLEALKAPVGNAAKSHVMLLIESRNADWAGATEQRIQQFARLHRDNHKFHLLGIECRETICEIQALGEHYEAGPNWDRLVDGIQYQTWNDFKSTTTSTEIVDGQFVILTHMFREDSAYQHCFVNPSQGSCPP